LKEHDFEVLENRVGRPLIYKKAERTRAHGGRRSGGCGYLGRSIFKLTPKLKILSRFGVGVDNINLEKATEYSTSVTNIRV